MFSGSVKNENTAIAGFLNGWCAFWCVLVCCTWQDPINHRNIITS